jgi:hypothetical protein
MAEPDQQPSLPTNIQPLDPTLHAKIVNPTTRPIDPFPLHSLSRGVISAEILSKSPHLLSVFAARGPPEVIQSAQEHFSFGSIVNADYRNETLQHPSLYAAWSSHIIQVLSYMAAPILESAENFDLFE